MMDELPPWIDYVAYSIAITIVIIVLWVNIAQPVIRKCRKPADPDFSPERFRTYLFRYNYEGETWAIEIKARNPDDARARLKSLMFAVYDGEK
jgi:hypothetical protein